MISDGVELLGRKPAEAPAHRTLAGAGRSGAARARGGRGTGGAPQARPQPVDPRGRCRLLQRLRAGDPRARQRVLRSGALRVAVRGFATPRRRAPGDRAGDQEHARSTATHLRGDPGSKMGGRGRRLRGRRRDFFRQLRSCGRGPRRACRSTCIFAAARRAPPNCSRGCWLCLSRDERRCGSASPRPNKNAWLGGAGLLIIQFENNGSASWWPRSHAAPAGLANLRARRAQSLYCADRSRRARHL